ncbi:MAG: voltage-gated potassium channel [Myxococcota bacterium]|jgi:voltage-gated potassium channel
MEHPVVEGVVVLLILLWVVALIGEHAFTAPSVQILMQDIGDVLHIVFALELLIRYWIAPSKRRFFQTYYLDLIAIIPLAWVRPLRLLRLLRVGAMVRRSAGDLAIVATLSMLFVLGASMLIDAHTNSVRLNYDGTLGGLWFAVYTFVGGEPIGGMPLTEEGRAITLVLMIGGMTLFGMFVGAVSASMATAFARRMEVSDMDQLDGLRDHVVVCGWNLAGPTMLQELFAGREKPRRLVVITEHEDRPDGLEMPGVRPGQILHICGDYTRVEVLEKVNIRRAGMAILLTDTLTPRSDQDRDARTVLAALTIERLKPDVFCCAELTSWEHADLLRMAGVEEIVVRDWYAGVIIGSMGRTWGLAAVLKDILSTSEGNAFHKINVKKSQIGLTVGQLHTELKVKRDMILVALERDGGSGRDILVNPAATEVVIAGDVLVVIGPH